MAQDYVDMYENLLQNAGKHHLMNMRRAELKNDADASEYLREAIRHLFQS